MARGGMGIVYLATIQGPARFSKLLVVKELKPDLVEESSFVEMFLEEARLAARLSHPNIVQTYEIGSEGTRHYMVMDYLEGVTLSRLLRRGGATYSMAMRLRTICEVLHGLHYAHTLTDFGGASLGLVHRDATPQNVFVTFDGQVKLVDFGIAKARDSTLETRAGLLKGKPGYMAPEQVGGDVDARTDVFGVGVMLWEIVADRRMWKGKNELEVLTGVIQGTFPSLSAAAPNAPKDLVRIVERAMARDAEDRYQTAADFAADVDAYIASLGQNPTLREIGVVVSNAFAEERSKTRQAVDTHFKELKAGSPPPARPPSLFPQSLQPMFTPSAGSGPRSTSQPKETPLDVEIPVHAPDPNGSRNVVIIGALAVALCLSLVLSLSMLRAHDSVASASVAESTLGDDAQGPAVPVVAATASAHTIVVRATPDNASILFDGVAADNPAQRRCHDGDHVLMRVSAPGYIARDREIPCDRDETLEVALALMAHAAAAPRAPVQPTKQPDTQADPPPRAPAPAVSTRSSAPIDTGNPWGK